MIPKAKKKADMQLEKKPEWAASHEWEAFKAAHESYIIARDPVHPQRKCPKEEG